MLIEIPKSRLASLTYHIRPTAM
ncbi:hypothetical protein M5D96_000357 [Drosophila gunungcola]|uniref:Uncharacterized protein n=1 Tax=Drosophila gunungcola TaxID=103775 RepID=A0A9P9YW72_9MUSC|nr:hypothetical protein M5D96_000357 [Drosophila gunungcola]